MQANVTMGNVIPVIRNRNILRNLGPNWNLNIQELFSKFGKKKVYVCLIS